MVDAREGVTPLDEHVAADAPAGQTEQVILRGQQGGLAANRSDELAGIPRASASASR